MSKMTNRNFSRLVLFILTSLMLITGCSNDKNNIANNLIAMQPTLNAVGLDLSPSLAGYRKIDTSFVAAVCNQTTQTGGLVVVYTIGDPTDQSGLRCYINALPVVDNKLVLSRRAEMKHQRDLIAAANEVHIREFLIRVQEQIFDTTRQGYKKIKNTDINGWFKKIDVLLDEPEIRDMHCNVFAYSDGIQSINNIDSPASYQFKTSHPFTLCLAGWKTALPCANIDTKQFEDPQGFIQFINPNYFTNN